MHTVTGEQTKLRRFRCARFTGISQGRKMNGCSGRLEPESIGAPSEFQHGQERRTDDHIGQSVGGGRAGDTEIAPFQRLDFRTQHTQISG